MQKIKALALGALMLSTSTAFADPIEGNWTVLFEDGNPKAVVRVSENNGIISGVVIEGISEKSKGYVGRTVITGLKVTGDGKYGGGRITDPTTGKSYSMTATLRGDTLSVKGGIKIGSKVIGRSQTWTRR